MHLLQSEFEILKQFPLYTSSSKLLKSQSPPTLSRQLDQTFFKTTTIVKDKNVGNSEIKQNLIQNQKIM